MNREYETAQVEDRGEGLLLLTLNRPEFANAMNTQMGRDLLAFFDEINTPSSKQRCIVLTGAGERAFCAGGDLKERNGMTDEAWQDQHLLFERMIRAFIGCPVPVIGAEVIKLIAAECVPGGSRDNLKFAASFTEWDGTTPAQKVLLTDAQTSGGLLLSVPQRNLETVLKFLKRQRALCAAVIGKIVRSKTPGIRVSA